jgi:predicted Fe-S protein YdhL (DUF1289 family)
MATATTSGAGTLPSPCNGLCRLDQATGWCLGCARTMDEISAWPRVGDPERAVMLARLPERLQQLTASRKR